MKRALLVVMLLACHRHGDEHEKDDSKKEGAHATVEDKRTAAEEAIHAYETAGSCDAKAHAMVNGTSHRDQLARCAPRKIERYDTTECDHLAAAMSQCHATARRDGDKTKYWLVKQANGQFLVDFLATERPIQLADLVARLPTTATVARIRIRGTGVYKKPFREKEKTHLSYRVRSAKDDRDIWAFGYAARDSPAGMALASAITSSAANDYTDVTVALSFPTKDPEVVVIEKVFGTDFFETDAERTFATSDGGT